MQNLINNVSNGDCLEIMNQIGDKSIDLILCDPPYGKTALEWDNIIPFDKMWEAYSRIIKDNGAIILFSIQPFTSLLVCSNLKMFRHEWVWVKNTQHGMMSAGKAPMKKHENILVFSKGQTIFNEQKVLGSEISQNHSKKGYKYTNKKSSLYNVEGGVEFNWSEFIHANDVLLCNIVGNRDKNKKHPNQKPIALLEYFIKTYSNDGNLVLDNTCGSGSTLVAARNLNRSFIGIEKDPVYYNIAIERLKNESVPKA